MALRFLQISDVHVDSNLSHSQISLPEEKRRARILEINALIGKACQLANDAEVEAILIPGDLWDDESVTAESVNLIVESFCKIQHIPIFIAPGNHDFYSPSSLYNSETQKSRAMRPWPKNVYVFTTSSFTTVPHPSCDEVTFTGRAFRDNVPIHDRLLKNPIKKPSEGINILLFHGSLDDYLREGPAKITAPFSAAELLGQGFSYSAIGHYHQFMEIRDTAGRVRAAYSGSPAGRSVGEIGPHYVLLGEVDDQGLLDDFRKVELDDRVIHDLPVDLTDADSFQLKDRVERVLNADQCKRSDIVCLRLEGRIPYGLQPDVALSNFADAFFHLKIFNDTRPNYNLNSYGSKTTEGRFVEEMKRQIEAASDPEDRKLAEDALYYGLDALVQKEVKPRYED